MAAAAERALLVFGMEALGETIENVGLAQEIQNGLVKSLQKEPSWADADEMATKQSEIKSNGEAATYNTRLGKYLMDEWSTSARGATFDKFSGSSSDAWDTFTTSTTFKLLAKYAALGDKVSKEPATNKQFVEARALGRGAFGVVFLVFKKDTGAPLATKKIVKGLAKKNNMVRSVVIEQAVLAKVRSRFCVSLHYSFQDEVCVYLVLSLCPGGDLWFLLQQQCKDPKTGKVSRPHPCFAGALLSFSAVSCHDRYPVALVAGVRVPKDRKRRGAFLHGVDGVRAAGDPRRRLCLSRSQATQRAAGRRGPASDI